MEQIPFVNDKPIYKQLAEKARYAALTPEEQELYELDRRNEMAYWDSMFLSKTEGIAEGEAKGRAEGEAKGRAEEQAKALKEKQENAKRLISEKGWSLEDAASFFGLTPDAIALS